VTYIVAGFVQSPWISLLAGLMMTAAVLAFLKAKGNTVSE